MKKVFNGTDRIHLLGFEVISLIARDKKETITKIEEEIDSSHVVRYIREKYRNIMTNTFEEDCPYNLDDWEEAFHGYSGYIHGNESRKYGIVKADDGLLLLLAILLELANEK